VGRLPEPTSLFFFFGNLEEECSVVPSAIPQPRAKKRTRYPRSFFDFSKTPKGKGVHKELIDWSLPQRLISKNQTVDSQTLPFRDSPLRMMLETAEFFSFVVRTQKSPLLRVALVAELRVCSNSLKGCVTFFTFSFVPQECLRQCTYPPSTFLFFPVKPRDG